MRIKDGPSLRGCRIPSRRVLTRLRRRVYEAFKFCMDAAPAKRIADFLVPPVGLLVFRLIGKFRSCIFLDPTQNMCRLFGFTFFGSLFSIHFRFYGGSSVFVVQRRGQKGDRASDPPFLMYMYMHMYLYMYVYVYMGVCRAYELFKCVSFVYRGELLCGLPP